MAKLSKPRCGSLAFVPRKRAIRHYVSVNVIRSGDAPKAAAFAGYKAGMTHCMAIDQNPGSPSFKQTISVPCTIIECPTISVFGLRYYESTPTGMRAVGEEHADKLAKELARKVKVEKKKVVVKCDVNAVSDVRLLAHTNPVKIGLKKTPEVFEIPVSGNDVKKKVEYAKGLIGKELKASDVFKEGERLDLLAITKGKGTQGPVKRFGIKIQSRKAHQYRRHVGAIGPWHPARVMWTEPMAGQMGYGRRTELNKRVLKIGDKPEEIAIRGGLVNYGNVAGQYMLVQGSAPGPKKRLIALRETIRPPVHNPPMPELKKVILKSQQGF